MTQQGQSEAFLCFSRSVEDMVEPVAQQPCGGTSHKTEHGTKGQITGG